MNFDMIKTINHIRNTVLEIRDLFCAPTGCIAFEKHAPGCVSMGSFLINFLYNHIENLKKVCTCQNVHTGCRVHPQFRTLGVVWALCKWTSI